MLTNSYHSTNNTNLCTFPTHLQNGANSGLQDFLTWLNDKSTILRMPKWKHSLIGGNFPGMDDENDSALVTLLLCQVLIERRKLKHNDLPMDAFHMELLPAYRYLVIQATLENKLIRITP